MISTGSKPKPTNKSDSCPVCGDVKGKCRTFADKPLVLCMTADFASGWKEFGSTKDGLWTQFSPETGLPFDRHAWQQRQRQEMPVALPQTMSLEERDRFYRNWLANGLLNERDRADLQRRGVTDPSIIALSCDVGYAVPFKGLDGKYVGAQWRYAHPGEGGRYRWHNLPGGKQFPGTHEMPLAVYKVDQPTMLALVDSTGVKPMLAAQRLNGIAVGSAGGNHLASPIQLGAAIEAYPDLPLVVTPDAGDVLNPHVMRRHKRTAQQFSEVRFLWWGQFTKQDNDIDEATAAELASARLLTWEEFEAIAPSGKGFGKRETEQRDPNWVEPDRELYKAHQARTEEEFQNLQIEARNEKLKGFPLVKWNPESLARVREVQSKIKNFDVVEQEQRASRQWERYLKVSEQWKSYQRNFKLSVKYSDRYTVERYDGYAPVFLPLLRTIIIRGGLGSGKTQAMLKSLLLDEWRDRCVVIVTPTNLLAEQVIARAKELGIEAMAYQGDVIEARKRLDANTPGIITMCPDSFKSYSTGDTDWSKKALFIDEFSSVRTDILDKSLPLPHVARAINEAGFLVAADAFTSDADVSAIENSFGRVRDSIFYIQNEKKDSTPVKVVQTLTKDGQISGTHEGVWVNLVAQAIVKRAKKIANGEKPKPIYICSNNLTALQTLRIWIKANYPDLKIARVSSLDVETNHGFIRNPDEKLVTEGIDILMGSPSMQSGCDIQTPFSSVIGIYARGKGASPTKLMQHIKRVRNADAIWISAQTNNFEDDEAADLDRRKRKRLMKQAKNLFQKAGIEVPDGFHKLGVWQEQIERLESQYSAELIQAVLCETFENVEFEYVEGGQTALYRELRDEVRTENALKTLTANRHKGRELIDKKKSPSRNQHVWDIDLAKLHKQFPTFIDDLTEDLKTAIAAKESGNYTQEMQALYRDCLDQGKILISGKLEKLKNHAIATSADIKEHLESMTEALALSYPTLHSKRFKRYRDVKLHNELGLESLAQLKKKTDPEAEVGELGGGVELIEGETVFWAESPEVVERYTKFGCVAKNSSHAISGVNRSQSLKFFYYA